MEILELFETHTIDIITKAGLNKTGRLLKVIDMCRLSHNDVLFIDDNNNQSLNSREVASKTQCMLAAPKSYNQTWLSVVKNRNGIISDKPCGFGTLEILNKVFND